MDGDTHKNLISRIRNSDMDEEAQEEAIQQIKEERNDSRPAAVVGISGTEEGMGGNARLSMGERTPVTVTFEEETEEENRAAELREETVYLTLNRMGGEPARGAGEGAAEAYDEDLILADYHLSYGQAKALVRLVDDEARVGTPGAVESTLRHVLGNPNEVNPLLRDIQENGVRGWRRVEEGRP